MMVHDNTGHLEFGNSLTQFRHAVQAAMVQHEHQISILHQVLHFLLVPEVLPHFTHHGQPLQVVGPAVGSHPHHLLATAAQHAHQGGHGTKGIPVGIGMAGDEYLASPLQGTAQEAQFFFLQQILHAQAFFSS